MIDIYNANNEPEQFKNVAVSDVVLGSVGDINNKNIVLGDGETPSLKKHCSKSSLIQIKP